MSTLSFLLKVSSICFELFLFCYFIYFYFLFIVFLDVVIFFLLFIYYYYNGFLDVFSKSVIDVLMNLGPWTGFCNAVLKPPSTSNPKS